MDKLVQKSFVHALGVFAYVSLVVWVMTSFDGKMPDDRTVLAPIMFLTLFVLSAAITASLVLGKPVMMFLAGQKTEAIKLFGYILGWLMVGVVILALVNLKMV